MTGQQLEAKLADAAVAQQATGAPRKTVFDLMKSQQAEIARALPRHMDADRFARIAMTQLKRTPALLNCDATSVIASVMRLAQVGLEPDGRNAYLVPYGKECTPIVSYMGYMELARRSGQVSDIYAETVHEHDEWRYTLGLHRDIHHVPASGDRGAPTHVYAVANFVNGGQAFVVLSAADVEKRRKVSKTASRSDSMWNQWTEAAWRKTAVRALAAYLPYSPEIQLAQNTDTALDLGKPYLDVDEIGDVHEIETGE